ncbi:multiple epidermal growth factor-like domains protein 10, partial [Biomphalaria pfeifferi]
KRPFLIVMAQRKTKLFVSLSIDPVHDLVVDGEIHPVGTHNWRTIMLESYQAFSLSKCLDKSLYPNISLTGSRIESTHPIGVISGSCSSIQDDCKEDDYSMPDLSSEMLLPKRMYGLRFVIVYSHQRTDKDLAWVTPSESNTTVLYYYKTSINRFHLKELVVTRLNLFNLNGYAISDKPVAMYLYINTTCQYHQDKGGPSISVVMPIELFFNFYAWVIPPLDDVVNFISLVIPVYDTFEYMLWNGGPIPYINVTKDEGLVNFSYNIVILELRSNATDGVLNTYFYFGCYFSGFSKGSFFQAAGFNYVDEKFNCSPSDDFNGDTRDNDCDGIYDEEIKNGLDDDGDGLIDEDTYNVSGCSMFGRWGRHCLYGCSDYCREDCDKDYGVCFDCVDGRMMPTSICLEACPEFTYGNHCQENCSIKCNGKDCLERYTGECEPMGIEVTVPWATAELNGTTVMPQTTRMPDTVKPFNSTIPSNTRKVTTTKLPQTTQHEEHEKKSFFSKLFLALVVISTIIGALGVIYYRIKTQPSVEELVAAFEAKSPVKEKEKEASPEKKTMSKEQVPETPKKSKESVNIFPFVNSLLKDMITRMITAWIGLILCQLLVQGNFSQKVNVTELNREFLLAFPKLQNPNICLLIYTTTKEIKVTISLTNPGTFNHTRIAQFTVKRLKSLHYRLDKGNIPSPPKEYSHHRCLFLDSYNYFGVHVHMYDGTQSLSSFMAVPVQAFGRTYVVVTHKMRSFYTVMAQRKTKVFVSLMIYLPYELVVDGSFQPVGIHNWRTVELQKYQAFSLMKCAEKTFLSNTSFTGSRIESIRPIGVISGSCSVIYYECKYLDIVLTYPDMASEMLLPVKMFGQNFVLVFPHKTSNNDSIIITTSEPNTAAIFYTKNSTSQHFLKQSRLQNFRLSTPECYVVSNKPVAIYYYATFACNHSPSEGGPSIMMILPNELFYNVYVWVYPPEEESLCVISLVIPVTTSIEKVFWNGGSIPYAKKQVEEGVIRSDHFIVTLELWFNSTEASLEASFNFGCYFSGFNIGSFFQAAGFLFSDEKYTCGYSVHVEDDGKDNDCDNLVDEELRNNVDDDGDELVDEDTYKVSDCNKTGRWAKGCLQACSDFCFSKCDINIGTCSSCVNGRTNRENFCLDECPTFTYGRNCKGNCSEKCNGRDCFERTHGLCLPLDILSPQVPVITGKLSNASKLLVTSPLTVTTQTPETVEEFNTTVIPYTYTTMLPHGEKTEPKEDSKFFMIGVVILAPILIGVLGSISLNFIGIRRRARKQPVNDEDQDPAVMSAKSDPDDADE